MVPSSRPGPPALYSQTTLPAEDVDRVFGTYGALAFAGLGQPEIGVRVVCRSGVQIQIKLERNMFRLALASPLASIRKGITQRWHVQLLAVNSCETAASDES